MVKAESSKNKLEAYLGGRRGEGSRCIRKKNLRGGPERGLVRCLLQADYLAEALREGQWETRGTPEIWDSRKGGNRVRVTGGKWLFLGPGSFH